MIRKQDIRVHSVPIAKHARQPKTQKTAARGLGLGFSGLGGRCGRQSVWTFGRWVGVWFWVTMEMDSFLGVRGRAL